MNLPEIQLWLSITNHVEAFDWLAPLMTSSQGKWWISDTFVAFKTVKNV